MRTWTTTTVVDADPEAVLHALTDPRACRRWAPLDFDVSGLEHDRLVAAAAPASRGAWPAAAWASTSASTRRATGGSR